MTRRNETRSAIARPVQSGLLLVALGLFGCGNAVSTLADSVGGLVATATAESTDDSADGAAADEERVLYQYIDDEGAVRFVDHLSDVPEAWRDRVGRVAMAPAPPPEPAASDAPAAPSRERGARGLSPERRKELAEQVYRDEVARAERWRSEPELVLYWANWCGYCKRAEAHLDREGVRYTRRDVDIPSNEKALIGLIGQKAVPVLDLDGKIYRGYTEASYDQIVERVQGG